MDAPVTEDVVARHATALPRYTSYPTANHFTELGADQYRAWLAELPPGLALSLYLHIPFCQQLCWYCGCSTKAVRRDAPVEAYVELLEAEIASLADAVPRSHRVSHVHFGGGSPDILKAPMILRIGRLLHDTFDVLSGAEFAFEIDPRLLQPDQVAAMAGIGVNRVSIGVQDFDSRVQNAIGRQQSFEVTQRAVDLFRGHGIGSINIDLVYGLPHQTVASVERTIEQVLALEPDRIAIFGYAHLPSRLKHQRMIDEAALPGPYERFEQARRLSELVVDAGYNRVGLDHFARRADPLASRPIARNFQGYTTDQSDALIGIGASAISRLPGGYAQNAIKVDDYARRLRLGGLATARGCALSDDDVMRGYVIERLMCDFEFSARDLRARFGANAADMLSLADDVLRDDRDGLVEVTRDGFRVTSRGRPFVRTVCARFDAYLATDATLRRHALAV